MFGLSDGEAALDLEAHGSAVEGYIVGRLNRKVEVPNPSVGIYGIERVFSSDCFPSI